MQSILRDIRYGFRSLLKSPGLTIVAMVALIAAFGYQAYRLARKLRGAPPDRFTWVTREEFEGTAYVAPQSDPGL